MMISKFVSKLMDNDSNGLLIAILNDVAVDYLFDLLREHLIYLY